MIRTSLVVGVLAAIASAFLVIADSAEAACRRGWVPCGRKCIPRGTVCCGNGNYCQRGNICIKGNQCLARSSERVCKDGRYCNEGFRCTEDYQCVPGQAAQAGADCQSDDPDRVISGCAFIIATDPDNKVRAMALLNRGLAYASQNSRDAAISDYDKSIELWPRAKTYTLRGNVRFLKQEYERAASDFSKAIELEPTGVSAYWGRGIARAAIADDLMMMYDDTKEGYDRIVADFSKVIELDPAFARSKNVYYDRAEAYALGGDPEKAIADYGEAISTEPGKAELYRRRASSYIAKERYDLAIADRSRAIELEPGKARDYMERAQAHRWNKHPDSAIADFGKAIELDPKSNHAYASRGHTYLAKGDIERAIADFGKVIELEPDDFYNYSTRANAYIKKKDREAAAADYKRALAILDKKIAERPDSADMYYGNRGDVHLALEDYDSAIADFTKAIGKPPSWLDFDRRARAYASKGDLTRAIADYAKAVEVLGPKETGTARASRVRALGYARFDGGNYKDAAADLLQAIELEDDATAMLYRFLARARAGEAGAAADLEANAGRLKTKAWPYAVIELYLGRRAVEATIDLAAGDEQRCQAHFYIGQWQLLKGQAGAATQGFKAAVETCPKDLAEYRSARAEQARSRRTVNGGAP